jgi:hypothetical protein
LQKKRPVSMTGSILDTVSTPNPDRAIWVECKLKHARIRKSPHKFLIT